MRGNWVFFGDPCSERNATKFRKIHRRGMDSWRLGFDNRLKESCCGHHDPEDGDVPRTMHTIKIIESPMITVMCRGELFNHNTLKDEFGFQYQSDYDVECIMHLYRKVGIVKTLQKLDGVFALCLIDMQSHKIYIARDAYGVKPLYRIYSRNKRVLGVSSEAKAISDIALTMDDVPLLTQVRPGTYEEYQYDSNGLVFFGRRITHFNPDEESMFWSLVPHYRELQDVNESIVTLTMEACLKRFSKTQPIGAMISGGISSSLMSAILVKLSKDFENPNTIKTFCVGSSFTTDMLAARQVSNFIKSDHHEITFTSKDVKNALSPIIYHLESFDPNAIKASVGIYLIAKYIKDNTDVEVLFSGDGAGELLRGNTCDEPLDGEMPDLETLHVFSNMHLASGQRADCIMNAYGLDLRLPFLDLDLSRYLLSVEPKMRQPGPAVEKDLFKSAFAGKELIPDDVLTKPAELTSNGYGCMKAFITSSLQAYADELVPDEEFNTMSKKYMHCVPTTKESYLCRKIFSNHFPSYEKLIPNILAPAHSSRQPANKR